MLALRCAVPWSGTRAPPRAPPHMEGALAETGGDRGQRLVAGQLARVASTPPTHAHISSCAPSLSPTPPVLLSPLVLPHPASSPVSVSASAPVCLRACSCFVSASAPDAASHFSLLTSRFCLLGRWLLASRCSGLAPAPDAASHLSLLASAFSSAGFSRLAARFSLLRSRVRAAPAAVSRVSRPRPLLFAISCRFRPALVWGPRKDRPHIAKGLLVRFLQR